MAAARQSVGVASSKAGPLKPVPSSESNSETSVFGRLMRAFSRLTGGGGSPSSLGSAVNDPPPALSAAEIRANIHELLLCVLTRLLDLQNTGVLPVAIIQLVHTIKEVTISAVPSPSAESDGGEFKVNEQAQVVFSTPAPAGKQRRGSGTDGVSFSDSPQSPEDAADAADMHEQMLRFEYSRYYTSCTALLFLRLICPAIITPDWMPRHNDTIDVADTEPVVNQFAVPSGALIVAAHSLADMRANPKSGDRIASMNNNTAKDILGNVSRFAAPSVNLRGIAFADVVQTTAEDTVGGGGGVGSTSGSQQQKEALFAAAEAVQSAVPIEEVHMNQR